jgi:hypothetical protein
VNNRNVGREDRRSWGNRMDSRKKEGIGRCGRYGKWLMAIGVEMIIDDDKSDAYLKS